MSKIKVFVIDDSAVVRHLLTDILNAEPDMEVIGSAMDPVFAMTKMAGVRPDVVTLDVEMPRMDGLEFLRRLMADDPLPVVMVSSLTQHGSELAMRALELGALEIVAKPVMNIAEGVAELSREIVTKVRAAASARMGVRHRVMRAILDPAPESAPPPRPLSSTTDKIIAIGSSTGGTDALRAVIPKLPESTPGVLVVQHMPPVFTRSFAASLNACSRMDVREATHGERVTRGTVLIAPGNTHMTLKREGGMYHVEVTDGPLVNFVRPSVDVLFDTVAKHAGKNAVGVILTGMGEDGARGLLNMKQEGAFTIAQDEETSVIFGMPGKAIKLGAAAKVAPLGQVARLLTEHF